jgi:chromosome segregation ATPase
LVSRLNQLFFVRLEKRNCAVSCVTLMEVITEYADHRAELEERIRSLESDQTTLLNEIAGLKEKLATLELERHATSLSNEVEALRTEKAVLEEKVATYSNPAAPTESYQLS